MRIDSIRVIPQSASFTKIAPGLGGGYRVKMDIEPKPSGKPRFKTVSKKFAQTDYIIDVTADIESAERAVEILNKLENKKFESKELRTKWNLPAISKARKLAPIS